MQEILNKIKSVKLCLMAHPDNQEDSEFEDRILDLIDIEHELQKSSYSEEEVEIIIQKLMNDVHCGDLCYGDNVIDFKMSTRQWFEQFKKK